ncbi:MAG TPA: acetyl-CoA carboxylase biotin carboxyl carrier protein [Bryobacteraceae bacterium]|nr:acetyl-CoA carboxylase biotin carboxyl carrier protein [Bryobacteraceae bacterium]
MTVDEIKELIQVVNDSGIAELEVQRGENRVRIRRATPQAPQEFVLPPAPALAAAPVLATLPQTHAAPAAAPLAAAALPPQLPTAAAEPERIYVKSPIVGTFYEAGSPGSPPFVKVGDRVTPGQVLCIIESMKLMNEIESEVTGTVVAKLVENGRPVEYGESLFAVQPS